ncbi:MAG TPA: hypothetical protein VFT16_04220 [Candidatus Saccharimonadales bacterium]|nr:hypothetical protein [Candidatus Saccharimonadales bacterium]
MYRHRFSVLLLRPSPLSSFVCGIFVLAVLISSNWSSILKELSFYDYFFGSEGLVTTLKNTDGGGSAIGQALASKSFNHNITIVLGAIAAGILLYILIRLIIKMIGGISMTLREIQAVDTPAKHAVEHEIARRSAIRVLVAVLWLVYLYLFIKVVLPFCILASQVGLDDDKSIGEGIGYVLFAFLLLFVAAHMHIVLARLLLLRPRVFGSEEVVIGQ